MLDGKAAASGMPAGYGAELESAGGASRSSSRVESSPCSCEAQPPHAHSPACESLDYQDRKQLLTVMLQSQAGI